MRLGALPAYILHTTTVDPRLSEPYLSTDYPKPCLSTDYPKPCLSTDYLKGQFNTTINTNINSQHTNQHNIHTNQQSTHKSTQSTQINMLINTFITASGMHTKRKLHLQTLHERKFQLSKGVSVPSLWIIEGPLYIVTSVPPTKICSLHLCYG